MGDLDDEHGAGGGGDGDAEAEDEAAGLELADAGRVVGGGVDDGADDDGHGADQHAALAAEGVDGRADEGQGDDGADLVHGGDDAGPDAVLAAAEEFLEVVAGQQAVQQRAVVAVHGRAAEANQAAAVQHDAGPVERLRRLLEQRLVVRLIAANLLDGGDVRLLVNLDRVSMRLQSG